MSEFLGWCLGAVGAVFGIYTLARIITSAYFKSREQYERNNANGTQQNKSRT